jgi:nicotinamidase-related amidase
MKRKVLQAIVIGAVALAAGLAAGAAGAGTIIEEWANVKPDPAPELKPVTIDAKTTALLVMDLSKAICNSNQRPRCIATIPQIAKLMSEARAKGLTVISTVNGNNPPADILPEVAPKPDEKILTGTNSNKFMNTDLEKMLKDKGITTIIAVGSATQGAVLYTVSDAGLRGFKVIVPVDGQSSESLYAEQAVIWLLSHAPRIAQQTTLTSVDMIKF